MKYTLKEENKYWRNPYYGLPHGSDVTQLKTGFADDELNHSLKPVDREDANLEAEKGEIVFSPDGQLLKVRGDRHSNGGTPLKLPQGSFVISDYNKLAIDKKDKELFKFKTGGKVNVKNNTPAKVLSKEVNIPHHNKMLSIMDSNDYDVIAKNTAKIMLEKNINKIGQVSFLQEEKKGFPQGLPSFSKDTAPVNEDVSYMKKQYKMGGDINPYLFKAIEGIDLDKATLEQIKKEGKKVGAAPSKFDKSRTIGNLDAYLSNTNPALAAARKNNDARVNWNEANPYIKDMIDRLQSGVSPKQLIENKYISPKYESNAAKYYKPKEELVYTEKYKGEPVITGREKITTVPQFNISDKAKAIDFQPNPYNQSTTPPPSNMGEDSVDQYYNDVRRTPSQDIALGSAFYNALNVQRQNPMRVQNTYMPTRLEKINKQPFLNAINNQIYSANRMQQGMNPLQARALASRTVGQGLDKASEIEGNIANQNVQIGNQENTINTQGYNTVNQMNVSNNKQYYDEVMKGEQNYQNLKEASRNQAIQTMLDQGAENEALRYGLDSQKTYGEVWVDPKTNLPVKGISDAEARKRGYAKKAMAPMMYNPYTRRIEHTGINMNLKDLPGSTAGMSNDEIKENIKNSSTIEEKKAWISKLYVNNPYGK